MKLSHRQAQDLMLAAQGLLQPHPTSPLATKTDVLAAIRSMEILQIDTINVVARSPYLVLWSRLGYYNPVWLDELLAEGALFEYWSHEASLLPIEDYPMYRQMMQQLGRSQRAQNWLEAHSAEATQILTHIRENGPVRSIEFSRSDGQKSGWWNWKPEKISLEMLHTAGHLMTARRHNFQRVYDLRERVLPAWEIAPLPSLAEVRRSFVLKTVRALGVTTARWVADYFRLGKTGIPTLVSSLADEGQLLKAEVAGWDSPAYIHPANLALAEAAAADQLSPGLTTLLSPFDPLVWDRARAQAVFNFDYRIECYTPAPKRRYGYFSLPILHRGALVGRLDPKAHRSAGRFEVKQLHLEPGVPVSEELADALATCLHECAEWHGTPEVVISQANPAEFAVLLNRSLARLTPPPA